METTAVNLFRFTVIVNPSLLDPSDRINSPGVTLMCNDILLGQPANGQSLVIPQGIAMIGFYLITLAAAGDAQAEFFTVNPSITPPPSSPLGPITWTSDEPTTAFLVQSWDLTHVTIIDFNMVANRTEHKFSLNIIYNNVIYTQDPTIVNEPPMQPGS
jgi:hypothetical protein